ncbi:MAG: hypothetical protein P4L40_14065 [Terracidiphilus sp.]|nr:hypothetical protein [Terracidiphilus sp.]
MASDPRRRSQSVPVAAADGEGEGASDVSEEEEEAGLEGGSDGGEEVAGESDALACPHCPFLSNSAGSLREHVTTAHPEEAPAAVEKEKEEKAGPEVDAGTLACVKCDFRTKHPFSLRRHMNLLHGEVTDASQQGADTPAPRMARRSLKAEEPMEDGKQAAANARNVFDVVELHCTLCPYWTHRTSTLRYHMASTHSEGNTRGGGVGGEEEMAEEGVGASSADEAGTMDPGVCEGDGVETVPVASSVAAADVEKEVGEGGESRRGGKPGKKLLGKAPRKAPAVIKRKRQLASDSEDESEEEEDSGDDNYGSADSEGEDDDDSSLEVTSESGSGSGSGSDDSDEEEEQVEEGDALEICLPPIRGMKRAGESYQKYR